MTNSTHTFAQITRSSPGLEDTLNNFFVSGIGKIVDQLLDVVALCVVGYGVWMIMKAVKSSNPGAEMVKKALWPFVTATLLLKLDWTVDLIGVLTKVITAAIDSIEKLIPGLA